MELRIENITKRFGEKLVLDDISLPVYGGRALGLLGRNGAGKTTTIRIIMNVFPADEGRVLLDGGPIDRDGVQIGYMPEERGMYPKKKVLEQLVYFGTLRGMSVSGARKNAMKWLERLEMGEYADKKLDTLSKGNQQKIQLAVTLIADPEIVILDEPFSGLDPVNAMLLKDIVRELIGQGSVVLFSSHQMNYIEEFCDDIAILNGGKIVLSGDIRSIRRGYDRRRIVVSGPQKERIEAACRAAADGLIKTVGETDDGVLVELYEPQKKIELMAALAGQALDIDAFRVLEPELSDIFVEYTEGAI